MPPHPVRGSDGVALRDELEIIGSHGSEAWARCRHCGGWFWTSTDVGGKYEYVGDVTLPQGLAEHAFLARDVEAMAQLVALPRVPYGPVWTTTSALVEIFRALTPGASDGLRARALHQHGGARWTASADLLERQAQGARRAPAKPVAYSIDLRVANHTFGDSYEVGAALLLGAPGRSELFRLEAGVLSRIELSGEPRFLAGRPDAAVFAITGDEVETRAIIDGSGRATLLSPTGPTAAMLALDHGWWLRVPPSHKRVRWIEMHRPDGTPRVKVPRQFETASSSYLPPPRRFGDGWLFSNLVDDDGQVQALTFFNRDFATAAFSVGIAGERAVTVIDDRSFWASHGDFMERWVLRGRALERVDCFVQRQSFWKPPQLVSEAKDGSVSSRDASGALQWTWKRDTAGATYGVATTQGVLLYDDRHAHLLRADGKVAASFPVEHASVQVGSRGTVFLKSNDQLWIVRETARAVDVALEQQLVGCAGDGALLAGTGCEWMGKNGSRRAFDAHASAVRGGSAGGPYVVEPGRIRVVGELPAA